MSIASRQNRYFGVALEGILAVFLATSSAVAEQGGPEYFEEHVRPLLAARCQVCHNAQLKSGNIDLSGVEGFLKARDEAALISAEEPDSSRLLAIVGYEGRIKMPPGGKLPPEEIAILVNWVGQGAPWPGAEQREAMIQEHQLGSFTEEQKNYWAFQPVTDPNPPEVRGRDWATNVIDRFVLAKMEDHGLAPAPPADKLTLLRRATFDLTGVPPTPREANAFLEDNSPRAFERVVDRLLGSPLYGERWAVTGWMLHATQTRREMTRTTATPTHGNTETT